MSTYRSNYLDGNSVSLAEYLNSSSEIMDVGDTNKIDKSILRATEMAGLTAFMSEDEQCLGFEEDCEQDELNLANADLESEYEAYEFDSDMGM